MSRVDLHAFLYSRGPKTRLPRCCAEHPDHRRRNEGCDGVDEWLVSCVGSSFGADIHSRLRGRSPHSDSAHTTLRNALARLGVCVTPLNEAIMREHLFIRSPALPDAISKPALYRLCRGCIVWARVKGGKINGSRAKSGARTGRGPLQHKVSGAKSVKGSCWWSARVLRGAGPWSCEPRYLVSLFPSADETVAVKVALLRPFDCAVVPPDSKDLGVVTKNGV